MILVENSVHTRLENGVEMHFWVGRDATIRWLNPSFAHRIGRSAAQWLGRPFYLLVHPNDRRALLELLGEILLEPKSVSFSCRLLCGEGLELPVVLSLRTRRRPDYSDGILGVTQPLPSQAAKPHWFKPRQMAANGLTAPLSS